MSVNRNDIVLNKSESRTQVHQPDGLSGQLDGN
jgi:hypothetical protein